MRTLPGRPASSREPDTSASTPQSGRQPEAARAGRNEGGFDPEQSPGRPGPVIGREPETGLWARRLLARLIDVLAVVVLFLALFHSGRDVLMTQPGACDPAPAPNCNVLSQTERIGAAGETIIEYTLVNGRVIDWKHGTYQVLDTVYIADPPEISTYLVTLAFVLVALVLLPGLVGWTPGKLLVGLRLADRSGAPASLRRTLIRWALPDGLLGLVGVLAAVLEAPWPLRALVIFAPAGVVRAGFEALTLLGGPSTGRGFAAERLGPLGDAGLGLVVMDRGDFRPGEDTDPLDQRAHRDADEDRAAEPFAADLPDAQHPPTTHAPPTATMTPPDTGTPTRQADDTLETWAPRPLPDTETTGVLREAIDAEGTAPQSDHAVASDIEAEASVHDAQRWPPPVTPGGPRLFAPPPVGSAPVGAVDVTAPAMSEDATPVGWTPLSEHPELVQPPADVEAANAPPPASGEAPTEVRESAHTLVPQTSDKAELAELAEEPAETAADLEAGDHVEPAEPIEADRADRAGEPAEPAEHRTSGDAIEGEREVDPYTPQWDAARQAYICWEPHSQQWVQWNEDTGIWMPITR